jgi:hypothetical protein
VIFGWALDVLPFQIASELEEIVFGFILTEYLLWWRLRGIIVDGPRKLGLLGLFTSNK